MPLETATYISDLVPSNPAASDGMNNADDHMRLIKGALQTTFPNINGAVTASDEQLNSLLSQLLGTTVYTAPRGTVALPGYAFVGDVDTGMYSPAAGRIAFSQDGVDVLNFASDKKATFGGAMAVAGTLAATGAITGPGAVPIGGMIMWLSDDLPTGFGTFCWANGGTLSRATVGAGKELYDEWSRNGGDPLRYGSGNGSTTFNVINMQETTPVGKTGMGGATSPNLLASITLGLRNVLGGLFGADTKALATANLPPYTPAGTITNGAIHVDSKGTGGNIAGSANDGGNAIPSSGNAINATQDASTFTGTAQGGTSTPFSLAQPSRAVNFIIRIA